MLFPMHWHTYTYIHTRQMQYYTCITTSIAVPALVVKSVQHCASDEKDVFTSVLPHNESACIEHKTTGLLIVYVCICACNGNSYYMYVRIFTMQSNCNLTIWLLCLHNIMQNGTTYIPHPLGYWKHLRNFYWSLCPLLQLELVNLHYFSHELRVWYCYVP